MKRVGGRSGYNFKKREIWASASLLAMLVLTWTLPVRAGDAEGEFDSVCSSALSAPDPSPAGNTAGSVATTSAPQSLAQQKKPYCQAAQTGLEGARVEGILWKVWAGVAGVCTYACAASFTGLPTHELVCTGASLAGGVTDAVMAKSFASILTSIMSVGGNVVLNRVNALSDAEKAAGKKEKDFGACLSAAMAGIQVFTKVTSMKAHESSAESNLESAKKVQATAGATSTGGANGSFQTQTAGASAGTTASGGTAGQTLASDTNHADTTPQTTNCAGSTALSAGQMLSCAVANDKNLPGFVTNPKFARDFNKGAGQPLGDFLTNSSQSPNQALNAAMGGSLSSVQKTKLADAIQDFGSRAYENNSAYASLGGGGGGAGSEGDDGLAAMMAGLAEQLNPNAKKPEVAPGVSAVVFANKNRTPAAVADDPKLSIFDRVAYRYYFASKRMLDEGAHP